MNSFIGWVGGKRALRNAIIEKFPSNVDRYIEVFGGAGWVLFGKEYSSKQLEVFNDADAQLINLYRCIKHHPQALSDELQFMLSSREIFMDCKEQAQVRGLTDLQRAAMFFYTIKISFGANRKSFATSPKSVLNVSDTLKLIQERLKNVVIENASFEKLIKTYDRENALFYCDPPYIGTEKYYNIAFTMEQHKLLAQVLREIKGNFILSYNDDAVVRELYSWANIEAVERAETLSGTSKNKKTFKEVIITNF